MQNKFFIVSRPFLGRVTGTGEQVVSQQIYNALIKKGVQVDFMHKFFITPYWKRESLIFYDFIMSLIYTIKILLGNYDLVIYISPYQTPYIGLLKLFRIPSVVIVHDVFFHDTGTHTLFEKYTQLLYKNTFRFADVIITTSEQNKIKMDTLYKRKTICIPLGVDESLSVNIQSKKLSKSIGYIGNYSERKRVDYIL